MPLAGSSGHGPKPLLAEVARPPAGGVCRKSDDGCGTGHEAKLQDRATAQIRGEHIIQDQVDEDHAARRLGLTELGDHLLHRLDFPSSRS